MFSSWSGSFRSHSTIPRRNRRSLGAFQALESRELLSASPVIYGPLQLSESSSVLESASPVLEDSAEPAPPPVLTPQDYNGVWTYGSFPNLELMVNSSGTKIKGKVYSSEGKDFKLKGTLDGLEVSAVAKGKGNLSTERGKFRIELTFNLQGSDTWKGEQATYFKKQYIFTSPILATRVT